MTNCITIKKNWFECPGVAHDVSSRCRFHRKNESHYIDGATKFMGEPGANGTPASRHMVQVPIFEWSGWRFDSRYEVFSSLDIKKLAK